MNTTVNERSPNNVAGFPIPMDEEEYLAKRGVSFSTSGFVLDKLKGNRQIRTENGKRRFQKECAEAEISYQEKRSTAKKEYEKLIKEGKVRPLSPIEKRIKITNGHPDNAATQAARRLLAKKGIDWKTGEKMEA